jgi:hypothetical protein
VKRHFRRSNIVLVNCATFAGKQDSTTIVAWRDNAGRVNSYVWQEED